MSTTIEASPRLPVTDEEPAVPRKRRKRAQPTGAADDCFTCANRNIKCDRRRPYCSQCLDLGQDCSGYKTQLTWGVGVASRGKLRGLSLPVTGAENNPTPPQSQETPRRQSKAAAAEPARLVTTQADFATGPNTPVEQGRRESQSRPPSLTPTTPISGGYHSAAWQLPNRPVDLDQYRTLQRSRVENVASVNTNIALSHQSGNLGLYVPSARSKDQVATAVSPISPSTYAGSPRFSLPNFSDLNSLPSHLNTQLPTPSLASPADSVLPTTPTHPGYCLAEQSYSPFSQPRSRGETGRGLVHLALDEDGVEEIPRDQTDECAVVDDASPVVGSLPYGLWMPRVPLSATQGVGKTNRMQYLINYYAEVISPVIVAFDSPNNPYRTQLLKLAMKSETLQHAISALSASNLRQRRLTGALSTGKTVPTRRSSIAHQALTDGEWPSQRNLSTEDQMREETYHKRAAVYRLNQEMANPTLRKDDSVLATLLVLCMFHICDSGIAEFRNQFAGVKKLLAIRGDEPNADKDDTRWMARMFVWFDAMAATVNDREGQFAGSHLDLSALTGEWAMENLAGVDARLFTTLARLGGLNTLNLRKPAAKSSSIKPVPARMATNTNDHSHFDGNGWMRIIEHEDQVTPNQARFDAAVHFWKEWSEVRHDLEDWTLDTRYFDSNSSEARKLSNEQRADLGHISESFRYAALLYTERLAGPSLPSSDSKIQGWVQKSLAYLKLVRSDVFLLWPLFIVGSECIHESDRNVIRQRCLDIQKDSGFVNNASCLKLLEKVWRYDEAPRFAFTDASTSSYLPARGRNAFRFRDVMKNENLEGEYIVL